MMTGQTQWDAKLGGTESLPDTIHVLGYAEARSAEIAQMHENLSSTNGVRLAFQRIPNHMRRRAMSHNVRRLPRRLREIHNSQMKKSGGKPPQQKRPSRKYRRRPGNLIAEYTRRRSRVNWLRTHIWHAKRFHMIARWGYRLPDRPCAKAFRACCRAASKHCLLQDASYVSCVQLDGNESDIITGLAKMTVASTGLTISAKSVIRGNRQGDITLFDAVSRRAIGLVQFQWRPILNDSSNDKRAIWFWIHAAYYNDILSNFKTIFSWMDGDDMEVVDLTAYSEDITPTIDLTENSLLDESVPVDQPESKKVIGSPITTTTRPSSPPLVTITELRHDLARFRLRGPLALVVLQRAVRLDAGARGTWFQQHLDKGDARQAFDDKLRWWEGVRDQTTLSVTPRAVVNLVVGDPRYNYPDKRTKARVPDGGCCIVKVEADSFAGFKEDVSPLWDANIRKEVCEGRESNGDIANRRASLLVPGTPLAESGAAVPVILVQYPGNDRGFGSGLDLILPSAWAQSTWLGLVLWGARTGGLRDIHHLHLEQAPTACAAAVQLHPDTPAGRVEEERRASELELRYFRRPPNKRCNYGKMAVVSPFRARWNGLLDGWLAGSGSGGDGFCVVRDKIVMRKVTAILSTTTRPTTMFENINWLQRAIVCVKITLAGKGACGDNALLCLPEPGDFLPGKLLEEPLRQDPHEKDRKSLRLHHQKYLMRAKRKRKIAKQNGKRIEVDTAVLGAYTNKMRNLWVPTAETPEVNIRHSCSRQVIGWTTQGSFSFCAGRYVALGYVALPALQHLLKRKQTQRLLVRATSSRQYRWSTLEFVT